MAVIVNVKHLEGIASFEPPNHSKTTDHKLLHADNGAENLAIWHGEVEPGGEAESHQHSDMEQVFLVLQGQARFTLDGEEHLLGQGDLILIPRGIPILFAFCVLLYVFIVYQLNILAGGFWTITAFLASRFVYEFYLANGKPSCVINFIHGLYKGTLAGAAMMVPIVAMLVLGTLILCPTATWLLWVLLIITAILFPMLWRMNYRVRAA